MINNTFFMEHVTIKTSDGMDIAGLLWNAQSDKSVLLLHMMPATKESWTPLAEKLLQEGFNVLAIDFRGHGESSGGDYKSFKPDDHQKYSVDLEASALFLSERYPGALLSVGGASIGANMALWYLSKHHESPIGFAFSAGLDYYGVRAIDYVSDFSPKQKVLFVGSHDDAQGNTDCGEMAEQLFAKAASQKGKIIYDIGGHGTDLWNEHPALIDQLIEFMTR